MEKEISGFNIIACIIYNNHVYCWKRRERKIHIVLFTAGMQKRSGIRQYVLKEEPK